MARWRKEKSHPLNVTTKSSGEFKTSSKPPSALHISHRYDFEIGYLVKSPCKNCNNRSNFPGCDQTCDMLDEIHKTLCNSVSCTKHG